MVFPWPICGALLGKVEGGTALGTADGPAGQARRCAGQPGSPAALD
jgi:hypothetical protein